MYEPIQRPVQFQKGLFDERKAFEGRKSVLDADIRFVNSLRNEAELEEYLKTSNLFEIVGVDIEVRDAQGYGAGPRLAFGPEVRNAMENNGSPWLTEEAGLYVGIGISVMAKLRGALQGAMQYLNRTGEAQTLACQLRRGVMGRDMGHIDPWYHVLAFIRVFFRLLSLRGRPTYTS